MAKVLLIIAGIAGAAVLGFLVGGIGERFNQGHCYGAVIEAIAQQAETSIKTGPSALPQFQAFMKSLPLIGYETNCAEVQEIASRVSAK
jgi:hypothetical protein